MARQWSRAEIEKAVLERAMRDEAFRARLVADPKGTLAREIEELTGERVEFPVGLKVEVHEETPENVHLVIPARPPGHGRLSDAELGAVAGGNQPGAQPTAPAWQCRTAYWGPESCQ